MDQRLPQINQKLESAIKLGQKEQASQTTQLQLKLIRDFASIMVASIFFAVIISAGFAYITKSWLPLLPAGFCGGVLILVIIARLLTRPGSSPKQARYAAELILLGILMVVTSSRITDGSENAINMAYLLVIVITGVLGLGFKDTLIFSILSLICLSVPVILEKIYNVYSAEATLDLINYPWINLLVWWLGLLLTFGFMVPFTRRYQQTVRTLEEQSAILQDLLKTINSTTEFGSNLSQELSGVTNELNLTSREHATNTQDQVTAVTEVTASLEELNETASQIAASASAATVSTTLTVNIAEQVREASSLAMVTIIQGSEAVEQTIGSVERVRNRIELLGQRLLTLTEQTRRVGTIIDLIDEIADETHLLALNASIEAAGTTGGEANLPVGNGKRGERFGVIAQEIKNLADRSRESTEEVREAINEMQGAVAAAVLVAEEGKKETAMAFSRSQISGMVIQKLNEVILTSSQQAEGILQAVEEVNSRCDEISIATSQQRTANQQILITMRNVAEVARESVGTISQISETVVRVNSRVGELSTILSQSNSSSRLLQPV